MSFDISTSEFDRFEWLSLEALWAITKSPFQTQWERWQQFPDITNPESNMGIIIGGNIWRANLDITYANEFDSSNDEAKVLLLSRAAGHIGKLAGGLLSTAAHFATPHELWNASLDTHLSTVLDTVDEAMEQADTLEYDPTTLSATYYYDQLQPVSEAINSMRDAKNAKLLVNQVPFVGNLASVAIKTWTNFMQENDGLTMEPGATPRSSGQYIEDLRNSFEHYVPIIHIAAAERTARINS